MKKKAKVKSPKPDIKNDITEDELEGQIRAKMKELHGLIANKPNYSLFCAQVSERGMSHVFAGRISDQIGSAVLGITSLVARFLQHEHENNNPLLQALKESLAESMS